MNNLFFWHKCSIEMDCYSTIIDLANDVQYLNLVENVISLHIGVVDSATPITMIRYLRAMTWREWP